MVFPHDRFILKLKLYGAFLKFQLHIKVTGVGDHKLQIKDARYLEDTCKEMNTTVTVTLL